MNIGVFGASGTIGRAIAEEANKRSHCIRAVTRNESRIPADPGRVDWRVADAADLAGVAATIEGLDVVVSAINSGDTIADQIADADVLPAVAKVLLKALEQRPATRLIVIGGGGSLETKPGVRLIDNTDDFDNVLTTVLGVPLEYRRVVLAQVEVLDICRLSNRHWTYVSPSAGRISSGVRTGHYRIGGDQVLPWLDGATGISAEDLAVAVLDEIEIPRHIQRRFTVG